MDGGAARWRARRKDPRLQIADVVGRIDDATLGNLNVPEFQRSYVWKPSSYEGDLLNPESQGICLLTCLFLTAGDGSEMGAADRWKSLDPTRKGACA